MGVVHQNAAASNFLCTLHAIWDKSFLRTSLDAPSVRLHLCLKPFATSSAHRAQKKSNAWLFLEFQIGIRLYKNYLRNKLWQDIQEQLKN